jgi:hypothetical protein
MTDLQSREQMLQGLMRERQRTDLVELAKRVEALDGPCRETDVAIGLGIDWAHRSMGCTLRQFHALGESVPEMAADAERQTSILLQLPRYTASLDAAMTLVPEGWQYWEVRMKRIGTDDPAAVAEISRMTGDDVDYENGFAVTPALALTAAAIRALAAQGEV